MKRSVFGHQLTLTEGLNLTPNALLKGLILMKSLGYLGMIVVPAAWDKSLTAEIAAGIAIETGMWLQVCGFLPGDTYQPHSRDGQEKALNEILRQMQFQLEFSNAGCGGDIICGPLDIGWKSTTKFDLDGYLKWIKLVDDLAEDKGMTLAIEPLNQVESHVPKAFVTLPQAIVMVNCSRTYIHYDTGHAHHRGITSSEFKAMKDRIMMLEFANVGRHPLSSNLGIDFPSYVAESQTLNTGCVFAAEPFDPDGVIKPLGLEKLCTTTTTGTEALQLDAHYLKGLGLMA